MAKCASSFTIMDYTDGISLISRINSNLPQTVAYDPTTEVSNPNWATAPLVLTPSIVKAGTGTDLVSGLADTAWAWSRRINGGAWASISTGTAGQTINAATKVLTVATLPFSGSNVNVDYKFAFTYHDDVLNLDFPSEIVITFTRISNGTSVVIARSYAPNGDQFKNSVSPAILTITAELIRGTASDTSNLTYQWQKYVAGAWANITNTTNTYAGVTATTLTVYPAGVDSYAQFRCVIKDTDSTSDTYNKSFTSNATVLMDITDPYYCTIVSSSGLFFKNGIGTTTLTCKVYQNAVEVDSAGTALAYAWSMTDKDGTAATFPSGTTANKKTLAVTSDMVNVKGNFFCEVS